MDLFKDIDEFSMKFGLPQMDTPELLTLDDALFRIKFLYEEMDELVRAQKTSDIEGVFDALIDLTYVALGTAWLMNLPFNEGWDRVHTANMKKERATHDGDPRSKRKHHLDIVKPAGWESPKLGDLL